MGVIMSLSFSSWALVWMGLEMNSLSFVSMNKLNSFQLKYFVIQSLGSLLFICGINYSINILVFISLTLKMASAPFYFWIYPDLKFLKTTMVIYFFIFQKFSPLVLISNLPISLPLYTLMLLFSILNLGFSIIGGLTSKSFQEIVIHSSVNQLGWLFLSLLLSKFMLYFYYLNYCLSLFLLLLWTKFNLISNPMESMSFFMIFSGFPPSSLFLLKLYIFFEILKCKVLILSLFIMFILVSMVYIYLKLFIKSLNYELLLVSSLKSFNTIVLLTTPLLFFVIIIL